MRDAFVSELTSIAKVDSSVVLITGDLGFGVLNEFRETLPDQFINAGVAEQNMTGIACGMALEGFKVYTYSIANFNTLRPLEQIRNGICYHKCSVTVVSVGAGFSYGQLGMSHFATEDMAILRALPNMRVVAPADPWEAKVLTRQLYDEPGPTYLRIDKGSAGVPVNESSISLGKVRVLRGGTDISIIGIGSILSEALRAAELLENAGLSVQVVSVHCLKPIDTHTLLSVLDGVKMVVTVEEHSIVGGLGSAVAEICVDMHPTPPHFIRVGLDDEFPSIVGDQTYLRKQYGMDAEAIRNQILKRFKS